jgi:hypothetical protein
MATAGLGGFAQPLLYVPPDVQLGLANGTLLRNGSVVRKALDKTIYRHLDEVQIPDAEEVAGAIAQRMSKASPKRWAPVVVVAVAIATGAVVVIKKYKGARERNMPVEVEIDAPECVAKFEASLRAYVDSGRAGALDAETVDRLITDLDAVKALTDDGNTVEFSFQKLEPLFSLVISHTSALAKAYSATLAELEQPEAHCDTEVVVHLRKHLEAQRKILEAA